MIKNNEIKISVRNLVEFILRSGDLDTSFSSTSRAVEGTRAHQKVQRNKDDNYKAEVTLKHSFKYKEFKFNIEGRADGIITEDNSEKKSICIDEIKSTTRSLETIDENYNEVHWAQAKCYAYIYSLQNELQIIDVQLTYFHLETEFIKILRKEFEFSSLEEYFYSIIDQYIIWANFTSQWSMNRDDSIKKLEFPFQEYRTGQRKFAIAVYKTIKEHKKLYVQAPTGIGKTISTIFPTVKAFAEGYTSKIFYLTAKTITRQVAEEAFTKMREKGLNFKTITLTAKDKICFKDETRCDPEHCEYAKGHFNRVNEALLDVLNSEDEFSRNIIEQYCRKHKVCPFEFSLDLAIWSDCVICDFNYVFDPRVYLKRFFDSNTNDYTLLIDEAHNLVDRSREMFSATLYKKPFLDLKKIFKDKEPKISKTLDKLNSYMLKIKKLCKDSNYYIQKDMPDDIIFLLNSIISESEEFLATKHGAKGHKELLELFFQCVAFIKISEFYDDKYVTYIDLENKDVKLKIFCLNPSYLISEAVKRGRSAIFFSATLSPIEYFMDILGGNKDDYLMKLTSPFDEKNLCIMVASNISTKYKKRESSYNIIAEYIQAVISQKKGNYIVFFPSYKYMNDVYDIFSNLYLEYNTIIQRNSMSEQEREEYLLEFKNNPSECMVAFAVMGGIFSEGIDLKGDRLIGAIIVGVGLPQICLERDIIKDYFDKTNNKGFRYSYTYPGMNKVLQAGGRVIRTEKDKGVLVLIDERFSHSNYKKLFPMEWRSYKTIGSYPEIVNILKKFYD